MLILFATLHIIGAQGHGISGRAIGATLLGGCAFTLMTISIFLSTRPKFLESFFGGLDRMYQIHKICGVTAGMLILLHFFSVPKELPATVDPTQYSLVPSVPAGIIAMILLVLSLALTLNRKIPYHKWRNPHKLIGLVYIIAIVHFMSAPTVFFNKFGPSGIFLMIMALIGVVSYVYSIMGLNQKKAISYKISALNPLERATEVVLEPQGSALAFKPGQFAFIKIKEKGWSEPHPFTISSSPDDNKLRFTMKVLGDWTRKVREELKTGKEVQVYGPYGCFDASRGGKQQVWLAGGIGITPFLSKIRAMTANDDRHITLVYAVREKAEALYYEELKAKAQRLPNLNIVLLESNHNQFARIDKMKENLPQPLTQYDYYLCGPKPMITGLSKGLKKEGVNSKAIHTEAFEFR